MGVKRPSEHACTQASSQSSGWPPLPGILLEPKAHVQCGDYDRMVLLQVQTSATAFYSAMPFFLYCEALLGLVKQVASCAHVYTFALQPVLLMTAVHQDDNLIAAGWLSNSSLLHDVAQWPEAQ